MPMSQTDPLIFNAMIEFFDEDEWQYQWEVGLSILSMGFSGMNGKWMCYAQAREAQRQFVFYSVLPVNVPANKRADVAEFITRANYGMIIGNWEMDYTDGEVRYKTSMDVEGIDISAPMIRQLVYANLVVTDRYLTGIMRVMYSDLPPAHILEDIEDIETYSTATGDDDDPFFDDLDDFDEDDDDYWDESDDDDAPAPDDDPPQ